MVSLNKIKATSSSNWFTYLTDPDGDIRLLIASINSPEYRSGLRRKIRVTGRGFNSGMPDDITLDAIQTELASEHLVLDWVNIDDPETLETIPYSKEKCSELLSNPHFRHLRDFVVECAGDITQFVAEEKAAAIKNSESASPST